MVGEQALGKYLDKWDRKYWATYKVGVGRQPVLSPFLNQGSRDDCCL